MNYLEIQSELYVWARVLMEAGERSKASRIMKIRDRMALRRESHIHKKPNIRFDNIFMICILSAFLAVGILIICYIIMMLIR